MKTRFLALIILTSVIACSNPSNLNEDSPEYKKQLLEEKKAQLKVLEKEIETLTAEVNSLFPK